MSSPGSTSPGPGSQSPIIAWADVMPRGRPEPGLGRPTVTREPGVEMGRPFWTRSNSAESAEVRSPCPGHELQVTVLLGVRAPHWNRGLSHVRVLKWRSSGVGKDLLTRLCLKTQ